MLKRLNRWKQKPNVNQFHYIVVAVFAAMLVVILFQCCFVYMEFKNVLYENFYYFVSNSVSKAKIETETISRELTNISMQISNDYSVSAFWHVNQGNYQQEDNPKVLEKIKAQKYISYIENIYLYNEKNGLVYSESLPDYRVKAENLKNADIVDILQMPNDRAEQFQFFFYPSHHYFYAKNAYFVWYPFLNSGNAIVYQLNFSVFDEAFNDILLLENSSFWIISDEGELTYGNVSPDEEELQYLSDRAKNGKANDIFNKKGGKEFFVSSYSEMLNQHFVVKIPQNQMMHTENVEKRVKLMIVLIVAFFIIVVLVAVATRFFYRELTHLKKTMKRMYNDTVKKKELKWEVHARTLFTDSASCNLNLLRDLGLDFNFESPIYVALASVTGNDEILNNNEDRELFKYGAANIICECVGECVPIVGIRMEHNEIAFVISASGAEIQEVLDLFEHAAELVKKHLQLDFMLLVSRVIDTYYEIDSEYARLKHLASYRYLYGKSFKSSAELLEQRKETDDDSIQLKLKGLDKSLRSGQEAQTRKLLSEIYETLVTLPISNVKAYVMILTNLLCEVRRSVVGFENEDVEEFDVIASTMSAETLSDVWDILERVFKEICGYQAVSHLNKHAEIGKRIEELIRENYANPNLGLTFIANEVELSSNYVSKIFKDYKKMTIPNYILNVRLAKVAELLEKTDISMDALVADSGFGSTRYLYFVFKKHFNMTPIQYRKMKRGESEGEKTGE